MNGPFASTPSGDRDRPRRPPAGADHGPGRGQLVDPARGAYQDPYVATVETHTGAVLFVGDLAYKVKKPVSVGFLDWTELRSRLEAIDTELTLNRRLAPDVYLGAATLPRPGGRGEPVLVMRRLAGARRLSTLVQRGAAGLDATVAQLADRLGEFHLAAPVTEAARSAAGPVETRRRWTVNHDRLRPSFGRWVDEGVAEGVLAEAHRYLDGRGPLLERRVLEGRARDGHGDLLADDVFCLDDGPRVLDCLDFDEHLRAGDVLADVAFLAMDLERLGRRDLGWQLLELHRARTADSWPASLAHHHIAYRAQVRALVATVRADQGDAASAEVARALLDLSGSHLATGRVRLVLLGGAPATGKSTLAAGIGHARGTIVLRSDEIRKELAGISPETPSPSPLGEGLYSRAWTERTYAELLERAKALLVQGESVVIDATWGDGTRRSAARDLAERTATDLVELRCVVDPDTARRRAVARASTRGDPSDAGPEVAARLDATFEPWPSAAEIDTSRAPERALAGAIAVLDAPPS